MHSTSDNAVIMYINVYTPKVYLLLYVGDFLFCLLRSCINNLLAKIITVKTVLAAAVDVLHLML